MKLIKLADYRPENLVFCGNVESFSVNIIDNALVLAIKLNNEDIHFMKLKNSLAFWDLHEASKILLNSMIAKIPICIDAEYVDDYTYHINDMGYSIRDLKRREHDNESCE